MMRNTVFHRAAGSQTLSAVRSRGLRPALLEAVPTGIPCLLQSPTSVRLLDIAPNSPDLNGWGHRHEAEARSPVRFVRAGAGFTLIEVIVCSMVFLFVATALASVLQLGMVVDQDEQSINEIISTMIVSRRYLLEGAPKGSPVGDKGFLEADVALLTETQEDLEEDLDADGNPLPALEYRVAGERYRVWLASGTLFRHCVAPSILPRESVLGNSEANLKVTTLDGEPFFAGSRLPGFVMGTCLLYEDRNDNNLHDLEEPSLPFRFSAALRNSQ